MFRQKRKMTLIEMITSIVAIIIGVLGLVIYISIASRVVSMVGASQEQNISREIENIEAEIISYTNVIEIILNDTTTSPILTQGVMQPEYSNGNIQDFMDELKILNQKFTLTLVDYGGNKIYGNNTNFNKAYQNEIWIKSLMSESISGYKSVSKIEEKYCWTVAVPIKYNGVPEGALIAEIPINKVFEYNKINERIDGIQIKIMKDDVDILTMGSVEEGWVVRDSLSELGVDLEFIVDQSSTKDMLSSLQTTLLLILMGFIFIAVIILIFVSKRYIVNPITDLKEMLKRFMTQGIVVDQISEASIAEIDELTHQYVEMSRIISQREEALIISEQKLIRKTKKLEHLLNELESTQSMVVQQEKLASIGRLAAGVAHELNSPIGFVNGNFDVLKEYIPTLIAYIHYLKTGENPEQVDFDDIEYVIFDVAEIINESDEGFSRIIDIVKNLKEYSRIDKVKTDAYDLNKGIKTTLMVAKNEYKYIAQVKESLEAVAEIQANGSEINEVILNIIVNAAHALESYETDEDKIISIKSYNEEEHVCCEISDNGPGIPQNIIDKIFDPFFTTKEPGKGTGLGLNIAYNIIHNKHEGELSVESTLGVGTTFKIKLKK